MDIRQYKDYSEWMKKRDLSTQKKYWLDVFADEVPMLNMPLDFARPKTKSFKGDIAESKINKKLEEKIIELTKKTESTEYMIFLSAAMILLGKYSRQEDIVIGSPVSARIHKDMEDMLGMFANTLAIRGKPNRDKNFIDFLEELKQICLNAYDNQEYPFEELVEVLDISRNPARNPLFDVFLSFQNKIVEEICFDGLEMERVEQNVNVSKFDLSFYITHVSNGYNLQIEYCSDLFKKDSIERLQNHYIKILEEIVNNTNIQIGNIEMMSREEKYVIDNQFNNTDKDYKIDKTVIEMFEAQVIKNPNKIAVISDKESISYDELNKRANSLAVKLKNLGVKKEDFVVIIAERSLEMMVGIYAILKAGGVYVPVSPSYPPNRIEYIINDCLSKVVLKYDEDISMINVIKEKSYIVLDLADKNNYVFGADNLDHVSTLEDAIYCIYTSGTTGQPKGVINVNKGLANRILWMQDRYPITETDVILQKTSYTFDVSVWEIVWWGIMGATVSLLPEGAEKDPSVICDVIESTDVTVIHFVPSMLNIFLSYVESYGNKKVFSHLKYIFSSGEALNPSSVSKALDIILSVNSSTSLINLYGPTEASIDVTYFECKENTNLVPIGKPISNIKVYIMDSKDRMTGIGVPGEICITGDGLARGYLNKEQLTKEKFRENLYGEGKMYHTGDYGRWLSDGNIEYLGRIDEQVKIRGFRIELGEIENQIRKIEHVSNCAVIVKDIDKGEKNICAFIVSDRDLDIKSVKKQLGENMPDYMVPSHIRLIDKIPLTVNGKLDRRFLGHLEVTCDQAYVEPQNEIESAILGIWKEILNIDKVSVEDNFFDIGGNSLSFIKVYFKINELYPNTIKIIDLFTYYTISGISQYIMSIDKCKKLSIDFNTLPDEYVTLSEKQYQSKKLKFIVEGDELTKYNQIIKSTSIDTDSLMKALYMCLLEEISEKEKVIICISENGVTLEIVNVDMEKVKDIEELVSIISKKDYKKTNLEINNIRDIVENRSGKNKDASVIPLIIKSGIDLRDYEDCFDMILSYSDMHSLLEFEFVFSGKISDKKCNEIIESFYGLLAGFFEEYTI